MDAYCNRAVARIYCISVSGETRSSDHVVSERRCCVRRPHCVERGCRNLEKRRQCSGCGRRHRLRTAVTWPGAGNLGGGGFMLIYLKNGEVSAIDYREKAPEKATPRMFLNDKG